MRNNKTSLRKVVFLDRDGIVNKDTNYLYKISDFQFSTGIIDTCLYLLDLDYQLIIVTNQSGIARGYFNIQDYTKLTKWMLAKFSEKGIEILDIFFCPHGPDSNCFCRKPKPGMLLQASTKYNINMNNSWMIGDREVDIKAANSAGIKNTILINKDDTHKINSKAKHKLKSVEQIKTVIVN